MSWLSSLFRSSPDIVDKTVDAVISTGDALVFTDEERAQARERLLEWSLRYLEATQPQNLARRYIAIIIVALWATLILAGTVAAALDAEGLSGAIFSILADHVQNPLMMVLGFYYMTHVVRAARKQ